MKVRFSSIFSLFMVLFVGAVGLFGYSQYQNFIKREEVLKQMIARLEAESRVAEVLVTEQGFNQELNKPTTTIKFLEYDVSGHPLKPKYYTFSGDIIQFQTLVVRFKDELIKKGDPFKGRSVFLFWKVFYLDGKQTEEFNLTNVNEVPQGYKIANESNPFETVIWNNFWTYALDPGLAEKEGIKTAQIEAPGTKMLPGILYQLKIEHDGGLRIDAKPLSPILRGETIPD